MAVMGSGLSDLLRAQQRGEQHQENGAEQGMWEEELPDNQHGSAQKRSGRSSA
jgi:hypothetical protein